MLGTTLCLGLALYLLLRQFRLRGYEPRYIPTTWLKERWRAWAPAKKGPAAPHANTADAMNIVRRSRGYDGLSAVELGVGGGGDGGVDRHTSVRSVMTLPAYTTTPRATEQLLGREGERAGIDTVVEFPETADEEESRRDTEMEGLYQIRAAQREQNAARRAEVEAREEARRLRRGARSRGDRAALEALRLQGQQRRDTARAAAAAGRAPNTRDLAAERRELSAQRDVARKVGSVAYAALGVARHDGSRLRSDSASSDARPLLDAAAGMGGTGRPTTPDARRGLRDRAASINTMDDDDAAGSVARSSFGLATPPLRGESPAARSRSRAPSMLQLSTTSLPLALGDVDADDGDGDVAARMPPPEYVDPGPDDAVEGQWRREHGQDGAARGQTISPTRGEAPPYESPTAASGPGSAAFSRLPSIRIVPFTPVVDGRDGGADAWPAPVGGGGT